MDFKVIWTDSAIADLEHVCEYIARDNPEAAEKTGRAILNHIKILETFPLIGPTYPRGSRGAIREIVHGKHRIFYEVVEASKIVHVLRIWHGAQDEPNLRK